VVALLGASSKAMMRRPALPALAVSLAFGLATPALAQSTTPPDAAQQTLVQGLQAQYEVALIRERKMADDRETEQLGALEARLKAARADADAASGAAKQLNAALDSARADYAKMAGTVVRHDPTFQVDVAVLKQQAETAAAQASPRLAAALQRFADGERKEAWPEIESEIDKAMKAPGVYVATKAADLRQLASLRDVMRAHGEAGSAEVLKLYDASVELDPTNFRAQLERARLARDVGDLVRARADAEEAHRIATTDAERAEALRTIAEQAAAQHDYANATDGYDQALAIFRRLAEHEQSPSARNRVAETLQDKGDLLVLTGDFKGAKAAYAEGLGVRQALADAAPGDVNLQDELASFYQRIGDLDVKIGDVAGARDAYAQGLAIRQKLAAAEPGNTDLAYYASAFMRRIGDLEAAQGDYVAARKQYEACLEIRRRLSAENPSSAQLKNAVSLDLEDLAGVAFSQGDYKTAREDYAASLAIREKLAAADPTNAALQQLILRAMARLARSYGANGDWAPVAKQYRKIRDAGQLTPGDEKILDALRAHGLAAGL
jgi:tetratricopeptide (TPR) repeat protein